jgi:hypothetical protein
LFQVGADAAAQTVGRKRLAPHGRIAPARWPIWYEPDGQMSPLGQETPGVAGSTRDRRAALTRSARKTVVFHTCARDAAYPLKDGGRDDLFCSQCGRRLSDLKGRTLKSARPRSVRPTGYVPPTADSVSTIFVFTRQLPWSILRI